METSEGSDTEGQAEKADATEGLRTFEGAGLKGKRGRFVVVVLFGFLVFFFFFPRVTISPEPGGTCWWPSGTGRGRHNLHTAGGHTIS